MQNTTNALPAQVSNSSTVLTTIFTTTNYSMFGHIGGNRDIDTPNLKKIIESISKKHIKTNAIICILDDSDIIEPLKIVDGQHRYEACMKLGIPVSYVIDDSLKMDEILNDITLMNTASKEWDVSDFMNSEAKKGNQNYILYRDIYMKYKTNFDHESLFYILNTVKDRKQKVGYSMFKESKLEFDISDYNFLDSRLIELSRFNTFSEIGGKRYFQKALNFYSDIKGYKTSQMMSKIQQRFSIIKKSTTVEGAIEQLREIYNYKQKNSNIVILHKNGSKILGAHII